MTLLKEISEMLVNTLQMQAEIIIYIYIYVEVSHEVNFRIKVLDVRK